MTSQVVTVTARFRQRWRELDPVEYRSRSRITLTPPDLWPDRFVVDSLVAVVWEAYMLGLPLALDLTLPRAVSCWSLYETAWRTFFHHNDVGLAAYWQYLLSESAGCATCKDTVQLLLIGQLAPSMELYQSEEDCVLSWRRAMRAAQLQTSWPEFDSTVAVIKPRVSSREQQTIDDGLRHLTVVRQPHVSLTSGEVMFLYSTAYGSAFTQRLIDYHMSGPIELRLLRAPNIVASQLQLKHSLRARIGARDALRNVLHMPDSLADTYANIACLFGTSQLEALIAQCYN